MVSQGFGFRLIKHIYLQPSTHSHPDTINRQPSVQFTLYILQAHALSLYNSGWKEYIDFSYLSRLFIMPIKTYACYIASAGHLLLFDQLLVCKHCLIRSVLLEVFFMPPYRSIRLSHICYI